MKSCFTCIENMSDYNRLLKRYNELQMKYNEIEKKNKKLMQDLKAYEKVIAELTRKLKKARHEVIQLSLLVDAKIRSDSK